MKPLRSFIVRSLAPLAACIPFGLAAQEAQPEVAAAPTGSSDAATALASTEKIPFLDYQATEIRTIITEVAELYELNVIVPDTLQGTTTLKLRNVSWREVFEIVLSQVDFTFLEANGIVRIVSRASLGTEPVRTEVIVLQFAKAAEISALVGPMLTSPGERVQVDARTNALVLTVGQSKGTEIRAIIERLDLEPGDAKQVLIDTKFIEANVNDVKNIGVNWSSLESYGLSAGPFARTYSRTFDQQKQDRTSSQGSSSTTLGNSTNSSTTGTSAGNATPSQFTQTNSNTSSVGGLADRLASVAGGSSLTRASTAVFNADEFQVVLSALKTSDNVKLVSNPTVVSLTNEEARINVTTKFPIILTTTTPGASGNQITETKEDEEFGISLKVTPQIRPQGLISLQITPEVSNLDGFNIGATGNRYPIIARRTVTNRINLRDGYTIALGGLVQRQESKGSSKVPVLGDIPGLGRLFRSNSDSIEARNLIVFITARVIDPAGNLQEPATQANFDALLQDSVDPRVIRNMEIERFDLPGFRPNLSTFPTEEELKAIEDAKQAEREAKRSRRDNRDAQPAAQRPFIK